MSDPKEFGQRGGSCQGRCEFHGLLYCKEWGGSCDEYAAVLPLLSNNTEEWLDGV